MPQVQHWASGICRVPSDLPDQARVCLGLPVSDPDWFWDQVELGSPDDYHDGHSYYSLDDWNSVWGLRALWWYSEEFVAVDAHMLAVIRNLLDVDLINGMPDCDQAAEDEGVERPDTYDQPADECLWCDRCRTIVMRDRIDIWLDRGGHTGSSYYRAYGQPADCDIEVDWAFVWSGAADPKRAA